MTETGLESPPKPQRVIAFDVISTTNPVYADASQLITKENRENEMLLKFEDRLIDRAVSDLPNIASQVFSLNKDQNSEIKRQQKHLTFLQGKVKEGEEKVNEIELEIKCVMNKIFMKEEESKDSRKRIKEIDLEIKSLITKILDKEHELSHLKDKADIEIRNLKKQLKKADTYRENVVQFEQKTSSTFSDLQKVKTEIEELKRQKDIMDKDLEATERLLSGVVEKELISDIENLNSKVLQEGNQAKLHIEKLSEERMKHKQMSQTIQVLHKRNTAQMTRLKRQLKELQTRNRQKQNQLVLLQTNMRQAEEQLKK